MRHTPQSGLSRLLASGPFSALRSRVNRASVPAESSAALASAVCRSSRGWTPALLFCARRSTCPLLRAVRLAREAGDEVGAGFDGDRGAGEILGAVQGLGCAAEVLGEEHFGDGAEGDLVLGLREAVALVREDDVGQRSEEHTSELQSLRHLVC